MRRSAHRRLRASAMTAEARWIRTPLVTAGVTACLAAGASYGAVSVRHDGAPLAADSIRVGTAAVVRTDLDSTTQVRGVLTYQGSYTVINQAHGSAYTLLPAAGQGVRRGQRLYEVDGAPVILLYGSRPAWRALSAWVSPGQDVAQLNENLRVLGYDVPSGEYYTAATAYAVELWQQSAGLPITGSVPLGQVVFAPGPLRITSVTPSLGTAVQP